MRLKTENQPHQILKTTIDTEDGCNLNCIYCLQGEKSRKYLPLKTIQSIMKSAEDTGLLEIYLSGAETTLHPDFEEIIKSTEVLKQTGSVLVTNGLLIDQKAVDLIRDSNLQRICISLDGPNEKSHNYARGKSFNQVMRALHLLQETKKPITVISVAHQKNIDKLIQLSEMLVSKKLANQHHIVSVAKSGMALQVYDHLKLSLDDLEKLQANIDSNFSEFHKRGLYLASTSYWIATGKRPKKTLPRTLTLFELSEQQKDCNLLFRVNGDAQLTSIGWSRELQESGIIGNANDIPVNQLFSQAEKIYSDPETLQMTRKAEAQKKYDLQIDNQDKDESMTPITTINDFDLLQNPLSQEELDQISNKVSLSPERYRMVYTSHNTYVLFDKHLSHVTLLTRSEADTILKQ